MKYHCNVCDKRFNKFIIFEGHFDFNDECRAKHTALLQCYLCLEEFRHLASLKYHLRHHSFSNIQQKSKLAKKVLEIPKITLKKQWNFKNQGKNNSKENESSHNIQCKICEKSFRSIPFLKKHLSTHLKNQTITNKRINKNAKTKVFSISRVRNKKIRLKTTQSVKRKRVITKGFRCKICQLLTCSSPRLAKHMEVHTDGKFECEICKIKFTKLSLAWHQKIAHGRSVDDLQCKKCKAVFSTFNKLKKHANVHLTGNVKCEVCEVRFTPNSLSHHQKYCRPAKILFPLRSTHCKICDTPCNSLGRLAEHKEFHKNGKFICEICDVRFSQSALIWHMKRIHPGVDRNSRQCKICKAKFTTTSSLKCHIKVHDIGKMQCDICMNNIRFTINSLLRHMRVYHPELPKLIEPEYCQICKVKCYSRATLDSHTKMHKDGKFECKDCQIKFTEDALAIHVRRLHSTTKPTHQCSVCKVKIAKSTYLEQHMKVHIVGDVKCDICNIRFTGNSLAHHNRVFHPELVLKVPASVKAARQKVYEKLKRDRERHQRISRALQFQCKLCKLSYADQKRMDVHMKIHTDGDCKCDICNVWFTKRSLEIHQSRFHKEVQYKGNILKALRRHISNKDNTLTESDISQALEEELKKRQAANKSKLTCVICQLPSIDARKLDAHNRVHLVGEYKCEPCNIWFSKTSLESHQRRCHAELYKERISKGIRLFKEFPSLHGDRYNEDTIEPKKCKTNHQCGICKVQCSTYDRLVKHRKTHIIGEVICEKCDIRFTTKALIFHKKRYHPDELHISRRSLKVQCTICKITCSDAKRLEKHLMVHEGDFQCDICNIPFTKRALEIHERRYHPQLQTNDLIEKALERNASTPEHSMSRELQSHNISSNEMTSLNDESIQTQYQCEICKIHCSDRKRLDTHMKVHLEGDIKCDICDIWFTKPSLGYHYKRFHRELQMPHEEKVQQQCDICKLVCYDASRLRTHMKVHFTGDVTCDICDIWFTPKSLVYHYKRFHPNVPKKQHILKAIENCVFKRILHQCKKCGKSFTRICYLKRHMITHRNGIEEFEVPIDTGIDMINSSDTCDDSMSKQIDTCSFECYVCKKKDFPNASHLKCHLRKHVVYQKWVDPLNIYLSNWNPEESREILLNQPLVLVENLDIKSINLKSLANFGKKNLDWIEELQEKNGCLSENDLLNILEEENSNNIHYDLSQNEHGTNIEIASINKDDEPLQSELKKKAFLGKKELLDPPKACTNGIVDDFILCISSDSDDDDVIDDIFDAFHCYFCNERFRTLNGLGEHVKLCPFNYEPPL